MNEICIVLYVNALYSQHLLNKPLTNRESNKLMLFPSQLFFSIVENLLRVYAVYYQYGYIIIHQFNKKRIVLQGFKLFPCDGVETTDSFYRLISALPIVIELVSGICKPVRGRSKFPTFLQYLSDLVLLHLYLRMYQQKKNVVVAERECVRADTFHNVKDKFAHLYLQSVAVAADNLLQGFGMQQRGFPFRWKVVCIAGNTERQVSQLSAFAGSLCHRIADGLSCAPNSVFHLHQ